MKRKRKTISSSQLNLQKLCLINIELDKIPTPKVSLQGKIGRDTKLYYNLQYYLNYQF